MLCIFQVYFWECGQVSWSGIQVCPWKYAFTCQNHVLLAQWLPQIYAGSLKMYLFLYTAPLGSLWRCNRAPPKKLNSEPCGHFEEVPYLDILNGCPQSVPIGKCSSLHFHSCISCTLVITEGETCIFAVEDRFSSHNSFCLGQLLIVLSDPRKTTLHDPYLSKVD